MILSFQFQSTPPSRVATKLCLADCAFKGFQSTPPSRVATLLSISPVALSTNFNPHHPRGWRRRRIEAFKRQRIFQSTPPSRVATAGILFFCHFIIISIHTTLAGGDNKYCLVCNSKKRFQSTPPSRVATISVFIGWMRRTHFNPHHPRGWRPPLLVVTSSETEFQSTPPSRVATFEFRPPSDPRRISIHTTLAGGDSVLLLCSSVIKLNFNPHHPRGWRLFRPLAPVMVLSNFNPHHPRGWRLFDRPYPEDKQAISIHTTLAGGDCNFSTVLPNGSDFNPHHPRGWRHAMFLRFRIR